EASALPRHGQAASSHSQRAQFGNLGQFPPAQRVHYAADQRMAKFVVRSDGIFGNRPRCAAEPVRKRAAKEDWKRQEGEEVGRKLDRIPRLFEEATQG